MSEPWIDMIDQLRVRMRSLTERADLGADTRELAAEALEELAVSVEELQAQNNELIASRNDLEDERERYRVLFETVPDGYLVTDKMGMIREVNATGARLLGKPRAKLVGRPLSSHIDPQDKRAFYTQLSRLHAGGPGAHIDINLIVRDDVAVPANLRATFATTSSGEDREIRWLVHDRTTDIATHELRTSEERLRALFDSASVGIVLTDPAGTITFVNQCADALLGRATDAVTVDEWLRAVHDDERAVVHQAVEAACRDGKSTALRYRICSDGATRDVAHSIHPFAGPHGVPDGSVSTIIDVTEEHRAWTELEDARDFTDAIVDTVGALVVVLDVDGTIERFNRACEVITGFAATDVIGRTVFETLIPEEERAEVVRVFEELIERGLATSHENDWLTASGGRCRISWTNTVLVDHQGATRAVIGTGIDVTENRLLQQRVAQADRLESVGRLAAGIAHDFNNTLTTLALRLDRLGRHANLEGSGDIAAARTTLERSQHLIADLLTFSRQQPFAPEPTDINAEIRRVVSMVGELLGDSITADLDLTDESAIAFIDPGRFERALTNLLLNARDAMPDGGSVFITTAVEDLTPDDIPAGSELAAGSYVRTTIADTGAGIDAADLPHVFDPYFTTKPPAQGTGLGLATTHGAVAQAGGAIIVDSVIGRGTTFTVWLPQDATGRLHLEGNPVILVVDDDPDIRDVIVEELHQHGYTTIAAGSAEEALERLDSTVDLLITDVQLPGMNGVELVERAHALAPDTATIYISGMPASALRDVLPDGATVLRKPFVADQLLSCVGTALAREVGGRDPVALA